MCSLLSVRLYQRYVRKMHQSSLDELMNGPIRKKLMIIPDCVKWGGTFLSVSVHLMRPLPLFTVLHPVGKYSGNGHSIVFICGAKEGICSQK